MGSFPIALPQHTKELTEIERISAAQTVSLRIELKVQSSEGEKPASNIGKESFPISLRTVTRLIRQLQL
jgi:hypothetical protein